MPGRKKNGLTLKLIAAAIIVSAAAFFLHSAGVFEPKNEPPVAPPPVVRPPVVTLPQPVTPEPKGPVIAIVIDDMGRDMKKLNEILNSGALITVAVLPGEPHSAEVAAKAHEAGFEVLLHLPMEPKDENYKSHGEGMLSTAMTPDEVKSGAENLIAKIPFIKGVNNHMGSLFTEDGVRMRAVMGVFKKNNLFFLDSLTTEHSVGASSAAAEGVKTASRDVFLDNTQDVEYIRKQFESALRIAKKRGHAIAIGHPYPETIAVIKELPDMLKKHGVIAVKVVEMVK